MKNILANGFGITAVIAAVAALLRLGVGTFAWHEANKLERPKYTVLERLIGNVEVRRYAEYSIAEVKFTEPPSMKNATSGGFRKVAGYIFGKNRPLVQGRGAASGLSMSMTAPVRTAMKSRIRENPSEVKVSFVMGSNYTLKSLPVPLDADVKLRTVAPHLMAVTSFSGPPPNEDVVEKKRQTVLQALATSDAKYKLKSAAEDETLVYGYHDPFITPGFLRKNEVGVVVEL